MVGMGKGGLGEQRGEMSWRLLVTGRCGVSTRQAGVSDTGMTVGSRAVDKTRFGGVSERQDTKR